MEETPREKGIISPDLRSQNHGTDGQHKLDHEERTRKRAATEEHKASEDVQKLTGLREVAPKEETS